MTRSARWLKFIESLKIRTRDRRIARLHYNGPQQRVWAEVAEKIDHAEPIRLICLKARREGISTEIESWLMAMIAGGDLVNALVTAHMSKASKRIWNMSKLFVTSSPLLSRIALIGNNTISVGRSILEISTAGSPEAERSADLTAWHGSETAFWPHPEAMLATMQTLPPKHVFSIGVIESTANGRVGDGELFYQEWQRAEARESEWIPMFLAWHQFDAYALPGIGIEQLDTEEYALRERFELTDAQLAWRRWAIVNLCQNDIDKFHQEYPSCLRGDVRVSTERGLLTIAECAGATWTESGRLTGFYDKGCAPVVTARTVAGREVSGTPDHPVQQPDGRFVPLGESVGAVMMLRPPRFADAPARLSWNPFGGVETTLTVDDAWGRFLGYFMGDGCYHDGTVSIVCDARDTDVVEDVRMLLTQIVGKPNDRRVGSKKGGIELRIGSVTFADLMRRLGIWHPEKPHRRVCVPEVIFRSPQPVVREFLRGLFEADGFNGYRCTRVVLFSKWPKFLRDVQLLLLGFGIPGRIRERPTSTNGYAYVSRTLNLRSAESLLFNERIGFVGARKRTRGIPRATRRGTTPPVAIDWTDRILSVEPAGLDRVYDITVADGHTFSANGCVVHNSSDEAFIQSGLPFFRTEHLLPLERDIRTGVRGTVEVDGRFARTPQGYVEVFSFPQPGHRYLIGADSSMGLEDGERGRSHSRSAAEVIDIETMEQVAEYDAVSPPHVFAQHLAGLGRFYGDALIAPEVQSSGGGGGREIIVYLRDQGYWNLHRWRHVDRIQRDTGVLHGWETNARTRPRMLARIREVVLERSAIIHSRRLLSQLSAFGESDSGRMESLAGHDDLLFAWGIALCSRSENYFKLVETPSVPVDAPNWDALGLHVVTPEAPWDRLKRLLALQERAPQDRSFLEL